MKYSNEANFKLKNKASDSCFYCLELENWVISRVYLNQFLEGAVIFHRWPALGLALSVAPDTEMIPVTQ
jgi:hypothetical protein